MRYPVRNYFVGRRNNSSRRSPLAPPSSVRWEQDPGDDELYEHFHNNSSFYGTIILHIQTRYLETAGKYKRRSTHTPSNLSAHSCMRLRELFRSLVSLLRCTAPGIQPVVMHQPRFFNVVSAFARQFAGGNGTTGRQSVS